MKRHSGLRTPADCRPDTEQPSAADFYRLRSGDVFAKCHVFQETIGALGEQRVLGTLYRVNLDSGLDHRVQVLEPGTGRRRQMICFDSNSYLGLHRHPRVVEATVRAVCELGYGTPSAQLLGGTNRYLCQLEETLAAFHGREDAMVFPSGYAANLGAITALVREDDLVVCDRLSHASIHDGCQATRSTFRRVYAHGDLSELDQFLAAADADPGCAGKLVVTDGVFSMHGVVAELPALVALKRRYNARLMLDDAHGTGVFGATGRGVEELFGLQGSVDVLMGTFSKAPGTVGGYVCGSRALVNYLRFYARSGFFTAALPAALCAGVTEAFHVMQEEPEHRERLWRNVATLGRMLSQIGLVASPPKSPIMTVFAGSTALLWALGRELFERGIKCGIVDFPAVPKGEALLRLTINAHHTDADLEQTAQVFEDVAKQYGLSHKTPEETREIGRRLAS